MSVDSLAEQLKAGSITLSEWTASMRDSILRELTEAMTLAKGGRDQITQSDWGFVGSQAKKNYAFLDAFAEEIKADPTKWLLGNRLNGRADLYGQLGYSALEQDKQREAVKSGWTQEANELEDGAAHCQDCLDESAKGELGEDGLHYVPIGTLTAIGSRQCCTNDRCSVHYRKPDGADGWIYGDE